MTLGKRGVSLSITTIGVALLVLITVAIVLGVTSGFFSK
jgi:uncharacterized membrane protein